MSKTLHRLSWTVVVEDPEHWGQEYLDAAHTLDGGSYDEFAIDGLVNAMQAAGRQHMAAHPSLFVQDSLI